MILRATKRLLELINPPALVTAEHSDHDWYANILWIERRKWFLVVHAGTLFSVLAANVRKDQLTSIGPFAVGLMQNALRDEKLPPDTFGPLDPNDVRLARTASKRVLGFMNDMAVQIRARRESSADLEKVNVVDLNRALHRTPYNFGDGYHWPLELAAEWSATHVTPKLIPAAERRRNTPQLTP